MPNLPGRNVNPQKRPLNPKVNVQPRVARQGFVDANNNGIDDTYELRKATLKLYFPPILIVVAIVMWVVMTYFPPGYQNANTDESPEIQRLRLQLANKERDSIIGLMLAAGFSMLGYDSGTKRQENLYGDSYGGYSGGDPYGGYSDPYIVNNQPYIEQTGYEEYQDTTVQNPDYTG